MSTLTIQPSGKIIEAEVGKSLLELIKAAGEKVSNTCDGHGECGTCHIYIQSGRKSVSKIGAIENSKLDEIVGVGSKSRLACQARILGEEDVTVELLGFSSGF